MSQYKHLNKEHSFINKSSCVGLRNGMAQNMINKYEKTEQTAVPSGVCMFDVNVHLINL